MEVHTEMGTKPYVTKMFLYNNGFQYITLILIRHFCETSFMRTT
jgi:hypothetical protein